MNINYRQNRSKFILMLLWLNIIVDFIFIIYVKPACTLKLLLKAKLIDYKANLSSFTFTVTDCLIRLLKNRKNIINTKKKFF